MRLSVFAFQSMKLTCMWHTLYGYHRIRTQLNQYYNIIFIFDGWVGGWYARLQELLGRSFVPFSYRVNRHRHTLTHAPPYERLKRPLEVPGAVELENEHHRTRRKSNMHTSESRS